MSQFESTEQTRYVKVFVSEEDLFTVTFCDYREEPMQYIPRPSTFKTNQTQISQDQPARLAEVISDWLIDGIDADGNCVQEDETL